MGLFVAIEGDGAGPVPSAITVDELFVVLELPMADGA